ncbi:ATP-binding protein [Myxococcus sp. RHSTA-1-4]|uniref:ATP-binding protein n=1 Tax=Myxococcus sp. RHSTA-1-4 TaxID=2874601 RepID=UPI001CBA9F38|nr:ATP-binding protein [Myxococcus sp. RHSTA-1-4]MBZ4422619.1 AAA family ATPase [Myxococcus sp. RHSTA-1-4]
MRQPETAFDAVPLSPAHHFRLYYFAAVSRVLSRVAAGFPSEATAFEEFPFLAGYRDELAALGAAGRDEAWWQAALAAWERRVPGHLPVRALREAARLDHRALTLLFCAGLTEEDARFGILFEALQAAPAMHRPTLGLLHAWWNTDGGEARAALEPLREAGLLRVTNPDAPRVEWAFEVPGALWDALRGDVRARPLPWLRHRPAAELMDISRLILPDATRDTVERLPPLLERREVRTLLVRGPRHGGRRTVVGALARALGRGLLEVELPTPRDDAHARLAGTLATLLHALPVVVVETTPGEVYELPPPGACDAPVAVVLGRHGGVSGAVERALTLTLETPAPAARRAHWLRTQAVDESELETLATRFRLTSGHIHTAAELARSHAALAGRRRITAEDVRRAVGSLDRQALDALATRLETGGDWSELAVAAEVQRELDHLERRCSQRERLQDAVGPALGRQLRPGVRALFRGPSGTGKTLAARLLAARLGMELYKVDLSSVVNKYIGETEKNLNRIFSLAEELDVVLLLDEGDALLAKRTAVQTSNDRYANLETNYLLQRIESFEGILVITTNAGDQMDTAFARRMDVSVDFRPPDAAERWGIWRLHLPVTHTVEDGFLHEVAARCNLSGGQIRNVVLHAATLALDDGGVMDTEHLDAAIQREYRKSGGVCPLKRVAGPVRSVR